MNRSFWIMPFLAWPAIFWPLLLWPQDLAAHHPSYPAPLEFIIHDMSAEEEQWTLLSTSGFVDSRFPSELICKEAFGVQGLLYATVLGPGHYAMASEAGLTITLDGCSIAAEHTMEGRILDLHSSGESILALEVGIGPDRLWYSSDGGLTLELIGELPTDFQGTTVKVLSSERGVVVGFTNTIATRGAGRLFEISFEDSALLDRPLEEDVRFPFLFAANSEEIAIVARWPVQPHLFWGPPDAPLRDAAGLEYWPINANFDAQGGIWLGGLDLDLEGLGRGDDLGFTYDPRFDSQTVTCVTPDQEGLFVCSDGFADGYEVWRANNDEEPQPFYRLAELTGPRGCPAGTAVAEHCPTAWDLVAPEIARGVGTPPGPGNGQGDGTGDETNNDDPGFDDIPGWVRPDDEDRLPDEHDDQDQITTRGCATGGPGAPAQNALLLLLLVCLFRGAAAPRRSRRHRP